MDCGGSDNFHDQFSKPFVEIVQKIFKIDNLSCNRVWGGGLDESDQAPTAFPPGSLCCRCPQVERRAASLHRWLLNSLVSLPKPLLCMCLLGLEFNEATFSVLEKPRRS